MTSKFQEIMKDKKAIVFDFDGTLIDSLNAWKNVDIAFFTKRNLHYDEHGYFNAIMGMNLQSCAEYTIKTYNLNETPEQIMAEWNASYEQLFCREITFYPKAKDFLNYLKQNKIPFGIATAGPRKIFDLFFSNHSELKDDITFVSCDDVNTNKPDPTVYFECMKRMGFSPDECVVFEDSVTGLQGAVNTGSRVVCALTDQKKREEKIKLAHHYFEDYSELI
ncbi:Beta-phosphoglucomutase [Hexamita inflata]|uniref:Beta-phosphoglucomutase n=1 Tax=Hexamita inflata TaxID=28002 RepID=A0AA86N821_9EUKA|nr:Beta-phosphoglucomutase [Hexamita inflata]CAI9914446.1 Beta-phosphoglucomutase [Hexamita inflata]